MNDKIVLLDGNSIMNRAFYGIMGSKALTTKDGKYTNAIYGFLTIMFKIIYTGPDYQKNKGKVKSLSRDKYLNGFSI